MCLSLQSMEYCTGLFVWRVKVCAHLAVRGMCVAEVRGGGLKCRGLCVFVIKSLRRLFITSVILCIESQMITAHSSQPLPHMIYLINCKQLQKLLFYCCI